MNSDLLIKTNEGVPFYKRRLFYITIGSAFLITGVIIIVGIALNKSDSSNSK